MSFADLRFRLGVAGALGGREYAAVYSPRIVLTSVLPRAVLQATFLVLIGRLLGGPDGAQWAFVGAVGYAVVTATVMRLPDVLAVDKQEGTLFRLRMAVLAPFPVALCRTWPYLAEAVVSMMLVLAVTGPLVGEGGLALHLLLLLPVFCLAAASCAAFGLAMAAWSVGRRSDVLVSNISASLLLVFAQVLAPTHVGWIDAIGQVTPLQHSLHAVRAGGELWLQVALEALVGGCWLAVAAIVLRIQARRGARTGSDDYT